MLVFFSLSCKYLSIFDVTILNPHWSGYHVVLELSNDNATAKNICVDHGTHSDYVICFKFSSNSTCFEN